MADRIVGESNVDLEDEPDQPPEEKTGILPDIIRKALQAPLRQIWQRDEERSAIGFDQDRSGIYGGFHCYGRR